MKMLIAFVVGLIVAPAVFIGAAMAGWLSTDAGSEPPKWESSIGMRAIDASLEKRSDGFKNPVAANDAAALADAQKIYGTNCAGCHGDAKGPSSWGAKGLYPRAPQFFQDGSDVTAPEAYAAIRDGVRYSGMGAWRGQLNDDDMWKVANFVASMHMKAGRDMD